MHAVRPLKRYKRRLSARFRAHGQTWHHAVTGNVSAGGVFILCPRGPLPGKKVELEVDLPGDRRLRMDAEVTWTKEAQPGLHEVARSGFGMRFTFAPEEWFQFCYELESRATVH